MIFPNTIGMKKLMIIHNEAILDYRLGNMAALVTLEKCKGILIFCKCINTANLMDYEITVLKNNN